MSDLHEQLVECSDALLASLSHSGVLTEVNPAWDRLLGFTRAELIGRPLQELLEPSDRELLSQQIQRVMKNGTSCSAELRFLRKDGQVCWVCLKASSRVGCDDGPAQVLLCGIHISSNKKLAAEQDAATIQALRFQMLAESTSDLVGFSDLRGNITYLNPAGRKLLNLHGTSWQGMSIDELSTPQYREKIRKEASPRAIEIGIWEGEGELLSRDGVIIPVSQVIVPIRDKEGRLRAMATIVRDMRPYRQLEEQVRNQDALLLEMSTPMIPITSSIVVMPLVGRMDSSRAEHVVSTALEGVQASQAKVVILDITGLRHVDTHIAGVLLGTAKALRLLGTETILTGIRAEVAQTMVSLGIDLNSIITRSTLQSAIAKALRITSGTLAGLKESGDLGFDRQSARKS